MGLLLRLVHLAALGTRTNRSLLSRSHHPRYELLWPSLFSVLNSYYSKLLLCYSTSHHSLPLQLFKIVPIGTPIWGTSKYPYNPSRKFSLPTPSLIETILCSKNPTSPVGLSSDIFVPSTNTSASVGVGDPFFTPHCTFQTVIAEPLSHPLSYSFLSTPTRLVKSRVTSNPCENPILNPWLVISLAYSPLMIYFSAPVTYYQGHKWTLLFSRIAILLKS